ncbi:polysaccharide deacetylase family protein [Legionella sp. PATHC035]|uniref:polysaccharide deacetylase family protein n=1 Tax=Legionella sp. PATHC035 TaxID=2992040 RepID=UPI002243617C|nr:polysaccharide deacetylase family protein [Legionella sp. PATHC035]MCW8409941.1 polysaccharide deacetylase family protein [Legionella sp. PATHC035]
MLKLFFLFMALFSSVCFADEKEIAITMDDLPLVASRMNNPGNRQRSTERFTAIVQTFQKYNVPVIGFVIAGAIEKGQWEFLEQFRKAGFMLGNHTYSHYDLDQISAAKYIADIDRADKILTPIMTTPKYFRYPYLAEGNKGKKQEVYDYLKKHNYTIAPVTIDSKDFDFNEMLYKVPYRSRVNYIQKIKPRYLAYIWKQTVRAEKEGKGKKQILLIHANLLNSYVLGDILEMYQKNGYKFISLTEALRNPAPGIIFSPAQKKDTLGETLENELIDLPKTKQNYVTPE